MRRRPAGATAVICLAILTGCFGGAPGTPSPTRVGGSAGAGDSTATAFPSPVTSPAVGSFSEPTPMPATSPGQSPGAAPASPASPPDDPSILDVPADWSLYSWSDGARGIALPPGWEPGDVESDLASVRDALPSASPEQARAFRGLLERAAGGTVRLEATGPRPGEMWPGCWVMVFVEAGDASLDAQVARLRHWQSAVQGSTGITTRHVVTPAGPATELHYTAGPQSPGVHADLHGVDVALRLPDGRSETVSVSGNGRRSRSTRSRRRSSRRSTPHRRAS